jgi:hypothetical protein
MLWEPHRDLSRRLKEMRAFCDAGASGLAARAAAVCRRRRPGPSSLAAPAARGIACACQTIVFVVKVLLSPSPAWPATARQAAALPASGQCAAAVRRRHMDSLLNV